MKGALVGQTFSGILLSIFTGVMMCVILIAWYDIFCKRKDEQNKFVMLTVFYVLINLGWIYSVEVVLQKYFITSKVIGMPTALIQLVFEILLEWFLFVRKYKGSFKKRFLLFLPYILIIPAVGMFIQTSINKDLVIAAKCNYYIKAISDVTLLVTMYLVVLIIEEVYQFKKHKKYNPQFVIFTIVLVAQLLVHALFEHAFLTMANDNNMPLYFIGYCLSATILLCVSILHKKNLKDLEYKRFERERQRTWEQRAEYYKTASEATTALREMKHDIKKYLLITRQLLRSNQTSALEEYLESVIGNVGMSDAIVDARNTTISAILTLLAAHCKENNIVFEYDLGYKKMLVTEFDLSTILGNILENAFEASVKVQNEAKRNIKLMIYEEKGIVVISCQNFYEGVITRNGEEFISSKVDKDNHGLGISNIYEAVKRYDGEVEIEIKAQIFKINVILQTEYPR